MGDGNNVLMICEHDEALKGCVGYLTGIADAMADGSIVAGRKACIPSGVKTGQLISVTVNYLTSHANLRHYVGAHRRSGIGRSLSLSLNNIVLLARLIHRSFAFLLRCTTCLQSRA